MPGRLKGLRDFLLNICNFLCCRKSSVISSQKSPHGEPSLQIVRVYQRTFPKAYYEQRYSSGSLVSPSRILPTVYEDYCSSSSFSRTYRAGDAQSSDRGEALRLLRENHPRCYGKPSYTESSSDSSSSSSMSCCFVPGQYVSDVSSTPSSSTHASWEDEIADSAALTNFRALTFMEKLKKRAVTHIRGHTNQASTMSEFAGRQCTMMSLYAIGYHSHQPMGYWTSDVIDRIIDRGDVHHAIYCEQYSANLDGKIALDELPKAKTTQLIYDWNTKVILNAYAGEHSSVVFLTQTPLTRRLHRPSLKEYIKDKAAGQEDTAFVITIWNYSYGLVKASDGYYYLFDSHGNLPVEDPVFQPQVAEDLEGRMGGASLTRFETLDALIDTLKLLHKDGAPCEARLITTMPRLSIDTEGEEKQLPTLPRKSKTSVLPRASTFSKASLVPGRHTITTAPDISARPVDDVRPEDTIAID